MTNFAPDKTKSAKSYSTRENALFSIKSRHI